MRSGRLYTAPTQAARGKRAPSEVVVVGGSKSCSDSFFYDMK